MEIGEICTQQHHYDHIQNLEQLGFLTMSQKCYLTG